MKKLLLRGIIVLLSVAMLAGAVPAVASAVDNEVVLTKIGHSSTDTVTLSNPSARSVTLTVPYKFFGTTIDLSTGLIIDKSSAVNAVVTQFPLGSVATIGAQGLPGPSVSLTVTYYKGSDTTTAYTTTYSVNIVRQTMVQATFTGTVSKSVTAATMSYSTNDVTFTAYDFTSRYTANDADAMTAISIEGSNLSFGVLNFGASAYKMGTVINLTEIGQLTFDATSNGSVSYFVRAYAGSDKTTQIGSVLLTIAVGTSGVPSVNGNIARTIASGSTVAFSLADFSSVSTLSGTISSIEITPISSGCGTWYNGAFTFTTVTVFTPFTIGNLKFTASGAGTASFLWRVSTDTGYSASGSGTITVTSTGGTNSVSYTTSVNTPKTFSATDFNSVCTAATGYPLSGVCFNTYATTYGALYFGYQSAVSPGTLINSSSTIMYYSGSPSLSSLSFVPASGFTGTATFTFTGISTVNTSFTGTVQVTVGGTSANSITYTTAQNTPRTFTATDFNSVCSAATGYPLSGVYFNTYATTYGALYYGYQSAANPGTLINSSSTMLYANSIPSLSSLSFVPASGFTGTATFTFTGVSTANTSFTGSLLVTVGGTSGSSISYTTPVNTPKTFSAADFNSVCTAATGYPLSGVYFNTYATTYGALYYGYQSASSLGSLINSSSTILYANSIPSLSSLSFVPASGFTGTATFTFTGVSTAGTSFTGSVQVTVGGTSGSSISYTTPVNTPKTFTAADFNSVCTAATGYPLSGVYFNTYATTYGALYYGYQSAANPGTLINSSSTLLYANSIPSLSSLSFVPASGFTGTATFTFTGVSTANTSFTGTIQVTVGGTSGSSISYTTPVNTPKTFAAADFNSVCTAATGAGLYGIFLTQFSSSYGTFYTDYQSASSPGTPVNSSSTVIYYNSQPNISSLTFVPTSGYTGLATFTFTGVNTSGTSFSGTIQVTVGGASTSSVTYTIPQNTPKVFSATDFNTACTTATGFGLTYISLSPPPSSYGTLYSDYSSASGTGTAITASSNFYMNNSPSISSVTFVPATGFTGNVTLSYSGINVNGQAFSGTAVIKVTGPVNDISYTSTKGEPVQFKSADFYSVSSASTGIALNYVKFMLPAASYGKLYYNYTSAVNPGTAVTSGVAFYVYGEPYLDRIVFIPDTNYSGNVPITYTGYDMSGQTYTGNVVINVSTPASGSSNFTDVGASYAWAAEAIDYLYSNNVVTGTGEKLFSPGNTITRSDFLLMLYRLTGFRSSATANFSDVPKGIYYYDALAAAKALGIAIGTNNMIYPATAVTRQDALLWIYRALQVTGITVPEGSASDIAGFSDKGQIASYATKEVEALVKAGIVKGSDGRLNPTGSLSRAEMAVILYRVDKTFLKH